MVVSIYRELDEESVVCIHDRTSSAIKKNEFVSLAGKQEIIKLIKLVSER